MKISEYDLKQIIENSQTEVLIADVQTLKFVYANAAVLANLGYSAQEILQLGPQDVAVHKDPDRIRQIIAPLLEGSINKQSLFSLHKRKNSTTYPVEIHVQRSVFNDRPALLAFVIDISEQHTTLLQLNSVIKGAALGYWDWQYQTGKFEVNERFLEIIGEAGHDTVTLSGAWRGKIHPDDLPLCARVIADCINLDKPYVFEFRMLHHAGHWVWVRGSGAVVAREPLTQAAQRLCGTLVDITTQKQNEREREQFFTFFQLSKDMMVIADFNGYFRTVNPAASAILGYTQEELTTTPTISFIHEEDRESTYRQRRLQTQAGGSQSFENRFVCKDGTVRWLSWCSSFDSRDGAVYGTARDITSYKHMVDELFKKEESYRMLVENSQDVIMRFDRHHRHIYANSACMLQLGLPPEAFIGKTHEEVGLSKELSELLRQTIARVFATGVHDSCVFETRRPLGMRTINWQVFPEVNASGEVETVISVARDLTDFKKNEEEMERTRRLNSLGLLAGGIAHDFNNILTAIFGNISLSKSLLAPGDAAYDILEEAEKAFHRASRLTSQLLTFAKGGDPILQAISIRQLIEEELRFDLSGSNVRLVINSDADLWLAKVDEAQMAQVFSNLCFNAVQAMPKGGNLYITLENVLLDEQTGMGLTPGRYLRFTVRDQGAGIEKHNLDKIFDPYFTTKKSGKGLGLATVYSVIVRHGGCIKVESADGEGACFEFYLPAADDGVAEEQNAAPDVPACAVQPARILIMDDEEMILAVASIVLRQSGYEVDTALDGDQAIALYKEALAEGRPINCLIMDLTIPGGVGGADTMKELLVLDPGVTAIVSSGYADDPIMASYASFGFKDVLVKPYKVQSLRETVLRVLAL